MKKYIFTLLIITGCSKFTYSIDDSYNGANYVDDKYVFEDKTLIAFNGGFNSDNEKIEITQGEKVYFDSLIKTDNRIGLARAMNVEQKDTKLYFYDIKKSTILKYKYMLKYKFVNVSKKKGKYYISYTNKKKSYL